MRKQIKCGNCSEPTFKMLRILKVWRIRQIKFQKTVLKMQAFYLFFEILLGSEQLQNVKINWRLLTEMNRIARFEKVSKEKFFEGWKDTFETAEEKEMEAIYESLKLPGRATAGSAGYDFFAPVKITLKPGETVKIPTGVRVWMEQDWVLKCYPRSGLGFKYRLQLNNTVGIIDSDYYYSDNEGQIFAKITNDSNEGKTVEVEAGDGFMQGIFVQYGITLDDDVTEVRNGGFGSTTKKK